MSRLNETQQTTTGRMDSSTGLKQIVQAGPVACTVLNKSPLVFWAWLESAPLCVSFFNSSSSKHIQKKQPKSFNTPAMYLSFTVLAIFFCATLFLPNLQIWSPSYQSDTTVPDWQHRASPALTRFQAALETLSRDRNVCFRHPFFPPWPVGNPLIVRWFFLERLLNHRFTDLSHKPNSRS